MTDQKRYAFEPENESVGVWEAHPIDLGWRKIDHKTWQEPDGTVHVFAPHQKEAVVVNGIKMHHEIPWDNSNPRLKFYPACPDHSVAFIRDIAEQVEDYSHVDNAPYDLLQTVTNLLNDWAYEKENIDQGDKAGPKATLTRKEDE